MIISLIKMNIFPRELFCIINYIIYYRCAGSMWQKQHAWFTHSFFFTSLPPLLFFSSSTTSLQYIIIHEKQNIISNKKIEFGVVVWDKNAKEMCEITSAIASNGPIIMNIASLPLRYIKEKREHDKNILYRR